VRAIVTVLEKFDELGSARQVFAWWHGQGLNYPVRWLRRHASARNLIRTRHWSWPSRRHAPRASDEPPVFLVDSPVASVLDAMLSGSLHYLMSPALLAEYRSVLLRPKVTRLHGLPVAGRSRRALTWQ
jgi:hypothetical protein